MYTIVALNISLDNSFRTNASHVMKMIAPKKLGFHFFTARIDKNPKGKPKAFSNRKALKARHFQEHPQPINREIGLGPTCHTRELQRLTHG